MRRIPAKKKKVNIRQDILHSSFLPSFLVSLKIRKKREKGLGGDIYSDDAFKISVELVHVHENVFEGECDFAD